MKLFLFRLSACAAATLFLCSCYSPAPRSVAFNEAAFARSRGSGSGAVTGTAVTDDGVTTASRRSIVKLLPVNAYTDEIVRRRYAGGERLEKPDPRYSKYVRTVHPDDEGHFTFVNLPAGEYYVSCDIVWYVNGQTTDSNGAISSDSTPYWRRAYARISVRDGQTTRVTAWQYGS